MNVIHDPDEIVAAWLREGPIGLPGATRRAIAVATRTTDQKRRSMWAPVRTIQMPMIARVAAFAIAVIAIAGGAAYFLGPSRGVGGLPAGASPTPALRVLSTPSGSASPTLTPGSVRFTSPLYRYSLQTPATWTVTPATASWPGGFQLEEDPAFADTFLARLSPGDSLSVKAQALAPGTTASAWLADRERAFEAGGHCFGTANPWMDSGVAGIAARLLEWRCDSVQDEKSNYDIYLFVAGDTGYVISGYPPMADGIRSFQAP